MSVEVILEVLKGTSKQAEYRYCQSESIIVGRQADCGIVLQEMTVSRYHCLLEIAPPGVLLHDFGSRNGTYLLRDKESAFPSEENQVPNSKAIPLTGGDTIFIGKDCALRVRVEADAARHRCELCGAPFYNENEDVEICDACMNNTHTVLQHLINRIEPAQRLQDGPDIEGLQKVRMLGAGTSGEAWLLADPKNGELLVCKRLLKASMLSDRKKSRFLREACVVSQLSHPNVIRHYGSGEANGVPYILLEYCPSGNLKDYIKRNRALQGNRLDLQMATHIILQALEGLAYVHGAQVESDLSDGEVRIVKGVVHRDIKPSNIFLMGDSDRPTVKLADFGYAKAFETAGLTRYTAAGEIGGTWDYIPRLQINNFRYAKPDVDIWAMAATYYYLLTGFPPRENKYRESEVYNALNTRATPIRKRNPELPRRLAEVIDLTLQEPEDRLIVQSAQEFKRMIEDAL